jgi:ligand-binding SRPBCC domain-containing protein
MAIEIEKCRDDRGGYLLRAECVVPREVEEVFAFFADARNLDKLTPEWLNFQILSTEPLELHLGQVIDYRLKVRGLPIRWQSEITVWEPLTRFVDEARRGPYRFWHHEHRYEPCEGGTRVIDEIRYGVPGGALIHRMFVRRDLLRIFAYRQQVTERVFSE